MSQIGVCSLCGGKVMEGWETAPDYCVSCGATRYQEYPVIQMEKPRYREVVLAFEPNTYQRSVTVGETSITETWEEKDWNADQ